MNINRERILHVVRHPITKSIAIGAVGFTGGIVVGFVLGRQTAPKPLPPEDRDELEHISNQLDEVLAKRLERERQEDFETFIEYHEVPEENTWEDEVVLQMPADVAPEETVIKRNVFAEAAVADDGWDYEAEKKNRDSTEPYVLHKDEFYADEMGFSQRTYTYFEGDDIMADEEDKPVYNYSDVVGELKFGHGSGSEKVVYIRNEKRKEEYEVVKDPGLFSVEVLGLEIEHNDRVKGRNMEHSTPRRFKLKE